MNKCTGPTFNSWRSMIQRCYNPNHVSYGRYGGKGISVCDRWRVYANFLEDMGERPEGKTLDRYPHRTGHYKPGNCRWATPAEQSEGKRSLVYLTRDGLTMTVSQWATKLGVKRAGLFNRIYRGTPLDKVLDGY